MTSTRTLVSVRCSRFDEGSRRDTVKSLLTRASFLRANSSILSMVMAIELHLSQVFQDCIPFAGALLDCLDSRTFSKVFVSMLNDGNLYRDERAYCSLMNWSHVFHSP